MNKLVSVLALLTISINVFSQECNCAESFDWMIGIFEKNDAGFQYVIDKKGKDDYAKFTQTIREKAKSTSKVVECAPILYDWLKYFRPGHIAISIKEPSSNDATTPSSQEIRNQYKNEKKVDVSEKQLIKILESKKSKDPLEGIWSNNSYTIGITSDEKNSKHLLGFIIKADSLYWMPNQIKADFTINDKKYSVDYYRKDHTKELTTAEFISESKNIISINSNYWKRVYPKNILSKGEQTLVSFAESTLPFVEQLSDKTLYLRIPSFANEHKREIDSVLAKYDKLLTSTPNLIVDIRNGTGGADDSYSNLMPYLYTNPIRSAGMQLLGTELNAQAFDNYAKQFDDTSTANYCKRVAIRMRANIGKFFNLSDKNFGIDTIGKILPYPQKVGIICNQNNGSTDEQFLLDAKQSRKVKVFGRPTGGMLDISNMNIIDFPNGKFTLGYCMSKSYRIPNFCIDGVGVQPDYFIDDAVSENEWINFTREKLEQ